MTNPFDVFTRADWRYEQADDGQRLDLVCLDCGGRFSGSDRAGGHCRGGKYGGCCKSFRSLGGFDKHRTGPHEDRRCLTSEELLAKGWTCDGDSIWRMPAPATSPWKEPRS